MNRFKENFEAAYDVVERATWAGLIITGTILVVAHAWGL